MTMFLEALLFMFFHNFRPQDLRTNEARLQELNSIADRLTAMGKTEAADKIREQIAVSTQTRTGLWHLWSIGKSIVS